jgi:preprotein translocase subunit SecF
MKRIKQNSILAFFILCTSIITLQAQEKSTKLTNDLSNLIDKSNSFQDYKVIKKASITNFQASLNSYIKQEQSIQTNLENQINANNKEIKALEKELKTIKNTNEKLTAEKANINFLGLSISKESYSITMWALFLGALAAAVILFLSFKRANKVTKESKSLLADLEEEYQNYRGVCVEREQSLRRQLFDEVKKSKDLKNVS